MTVSGQTGRTHREGAKMKVLLKNFQNVNGHDIVISYGSKILIVIISINIDYCLFNGFVLDLFHAQNSGPNGPKFSDHWALIIWTTHRADSECPR